MRGSKWLGLNLWNGKNHIENEEAPNFWFKSSFCPIPDRLYRYMFKLYRYNFATATFWISCTGTCLSCTSTTSPLLVFSKLYRYMFKLYQYNCSQTDFFFSSLFFFLKKYIYIYIYIFFFFFSLGSSSVDVSFGISMAFHPGFRCMSPFSLAQIPQLTVFVYLVTGISS